MHFTHDFRSVYATVLEQWIGINSNPILDSKFDQFEGVFSR